MIARAPQPRYRVAAVWFDGWLRVFVVGVVASLATVALGPLPQMAVLGAATLVCSLLGSVACIVGLSLYHPARWREVRGHVIRVGDSLHRTAETIGEPRPMHARVEPH
jgi:hypothetical protein